jgi:hypothetical protein
MKVINSNSTFYFRKCHLKTKGRVMKKLMIQCQSSANSEEMCPTPPKSTSKPRRLVGRKRSSNGPDALMQEAVSVLSQIKDRTVTPSQPKADDEDDIFGKHVASEMCKIQDMRQKGLHE